MSCVDARIIDWNYITKENVELTASSEDTEFPITNLRQDFRSKVWRTSGHFEITSSNNKIDFKESSGGPELTATLTTGHYAPSSLAAHIKAKMEAVGGETYSISFSGGKWTFSTGGTFLSLLHETGSNSGSSVASSLGFSSEDYLGDISYAGPKIAIHTDETLLIDLQTSEEIDSFGIVFDPVLPITFSLDAKIYLQASATDNWVAPPVSELLSLDDINESVTHFFETAIEYRFFRLKMVDPQNPNLYLEVPKVFLGKRIEIARAPDVGFSYVLEDKSRTLETEFGHEYVDVYPIRKRIEIDYSVLEKTQSEELLKSFQRVGTGTPIFFCMDTEETLFDKDRFSVWGKYAPVLDTSHLVTKYFRHKIIIREAF